MDSITDEEQGFRCIKVFTPYDKYNHMAYYAYDIDQYGILDFGTVVMTSMGVGAIILT